MTLRKINKIAFLAIFFVLFNIIPFNSNVTAAFRYLQEGMASPEIKGKDITTGENISSTKLQKDNIVIITFWATWSKRSIDLLIDLKSFAIEHEDLAVKIIAVNVNNQKISAEEKKEILDKVSELDLPFSVILDDNLGFFYEFGVIAVPSTAILDTTGVLRYAPSGYSLTTKDLIIDSVEVLLGLKKPTVTTLVKEGYRPKSKSSRYFRLALQMANKRMYERALSNLELSQKADTLFSAPHNLRGQIFLEMDSAAIAIKEFEIALQLDSSSIAALAGLGRAFLKDGQVDSAYKKLSELRAKDETYTPALLDLALCMSEKEQFSDAIDSLQKAIELNPKDPTVHYYMGKVYMKLNQPAEAAESFRTALELLYPIP